MVITNGEGVDYALDAVGSERILSFGLTVLAIRGTLLTIGGPPSVTTTVAVPIGQMLARGQRYIGTHQGNAKPTEVIRVFRPFDRVN